MPAVGIIPTPSVHVGMAGYWVGHLWLSCLIMFTGGQIDKTRWKNGRKETWVTVTVKSRYYDVTRFYEI